jgi:hypothetical protein
LTGTIANENKDNNIIMTTRVAISIINQKSSAKILQLHCHVRPGASKVREGVVAITDEAIELCVSARAQDGKANKGVLQVLSEVSKYISHYLSLPPLSEHKCWVFVSIKFS